MVDFVPAQTSVPEWVMTYCRQLADVHYSRRLNRMYVQMLQGFLAYEPWKATPPLAWRYASVHRVTGGRAIRGVDSGWVPMNMMIPVELIELIRFKIDAVNANATEEGRNLSLRTFLYTAVYWWCSSVYPYSGPGMLEAS